MTQINPNPEVVADLLSRYTFATLQDLQGAVGELSTGLRLSMEHTQAYGIALDQKLPADIERTSAAPYVHPHNIASALVSVAHAGQIVLDSTLLVFAGTWVPVASTPVPTVQVTIVVAPPPVHVPPAPAPPPPPPAPGIPPAPAAQGGVDLVGLVDAAMGTGPAIVAPSSVPATPVVPSTAPAPITTPAQFADYRDAQGHPETRGVIEGTATRVAAAAPPAPSQNQQHVTLEQARAQAANAEAVGLPDPSVLAERRTETGRPQKSPFERKVEPRNKVAEPPFWWPFVRHSASRLFAENPASALDPSSTGAGPVQAYALTVQIAQELLRCTDGSLTVSELRAYLRDVETGINALPSAGPIYQLVEHLFKDEK